MRVTDCLQGSAFHISAEAVASYCQAHSAVFSSFINASILVWIFHLVIKGRDTDPPLDCITLEDPSLYCAERTASSAEKQINQQSIMIPDALFIPSIHSFS